MLGVRRISAPVFLAITFSSGSAHLNLRESSGHSGIQLKRSGI
jgi:hypothetical protein